MRLRIIEAAINNKIELITFPSYLMGKLEPLDKCELMNIFRMSPGIPPNFKLGMLSSESSTFQPTKKKKVVPHL